MRIRSHDPESPEEVELRFQELHAQQTRAVLLFHGYGGERDLDDDFDSADDPYDE